MEQPIGPPSVQSASAASPVQLSIRLGLLAGLIYWSYILILPFIPILVWSAILAVALYPVFDALARLLGGRPVVSATLITILGLTIMIGPASWLVFGLVEGVRFISEGAASGRGRNPGPSARKWHCGGASPGWCAAGARLYPTT